MNKDDLQKLNIPTLGELALHDILDFYDTPIVFVTRDVFETLYLFLLTIQTTEKTEWLVTKISKRRYLELKYNKITLKSAFTNTESSKYYLVSDHNNGETTINQYDKLPEGKITEYEYFVGENIEIIPDAYNTLENAQQTYKNTVDIISKGEFDEFSSKFEKCQDAIRNIDGKTGSDAFDELSKILFIKIFLEEHEPNSKVFSTKSINEFGVSIIKDTYFKKVKDKYNDIFKSDDHIELKDESIIEIVKILEPYTLKNTEIDVKGRAYEI